MTIQVGLEMPKIKFDANGGIMINAAPGSSGQDFDFFEGKWNVHNRKLKTRLDNCTEWTEFESTQEMHKVLRGQGNIDNYLAIFDGAHFEGMSIRLFNPKTRLWSIYWADSVEGMLQPGVLGSFDNNLGHFFAKDSFKGKKILVGFRWDIRDIENPVWSQAFSQDNGESWEWNWYMFFSK